MNVTFHSNILTFVHVPHKDPLADCSNSRLRKYRIAGNRRDFRRLTAGGRDYYVQDYLPIFVGPLRQFGRDEFHQETTKYPLGQANTSIHRAQGTRAYVLHFLSRTTLLPCSENQSENDDDQHCSNHVANLNSKQSELLTGAAVTQVSQRKSVFNHGG